MNTNNEYVIMNPVTAWCPCKYCINGLFSDYFYISYMYKLRKDKFKINKCKKSKAELVGFFLNSETKV